MTRRQKFLEEEEALQKRKRQDWKERKAAMKREAIQQSLPPESEPQAQEKPWATLPGNPRIARNGPVMAGSFSDLFPDRSLHAKREQDRLNLLARLRHQVEIRNLIEGEPMTSEPSGEITLGGRKRYRPDWNYGP
jgi:hypothetical protein